MPVAIITGAASGIGAAALRRFCADGLAVVAVDRDTEALAVICDEITADGGRVVACPADLRHEQAAVDAVARAVEHFGRIDVLYNNAGVFPDEGPLHEADLRRWDLVLAINLRATAAMCKHALPVMTAGGGGSIINTSSAEGRAGDSGWTSYAAAKAGVEALTRSVATQYGGQGIRCNAVAPGLIRTRSVGLLSEAQVSTFERNTLLGRLGEPDDVVDVVAFLASTRSAYVTGQILAVDGGLLSHLPLP